MGFIGTMLVIIVAYWLGFFTAAMLSVAKRADEQAEQLRRGK